MSAPQMTTDEPDPRAVAAERLTFFADAVIAIAITLLALDLPLPEGDTNHALLHSAVVDRGEFTAFAISFFVVGFYWSHHHKVFRYVTVLGGRMVGLTLAWLFLLVLIPFGTKVLSGGGALQVRFVFYAAIQALAGLVWVIMVREIQRNHLYRADTPPDLFSHAYFGSGGAAAGFLVSIPVAFFTDSPPYIFWIVLPVLSGLLRRLVNRRRRVSGSAE